MAERKTKEILISNPEMVSGRSSVVEVSVSNDCVWFTRQGLTLHWALNDWQDLVDFVFDRTKTTPQVPTKEGDNR